MHLLRVKTSSAGAAAGDCHDGGLQQPPSAGSTPGSPSCASTCCWGMPADMVMASGGMPHTPRQQGCWNSGETALLQAAPAGLAAAASSLQHRGLRVALPDGGAATAAQAPPSARRVLSITGEYGSVANWLDAQVGKRQGRQGALLSARSHANLALLEPAGEAAATPSTAGSSASSASADLPAPAFQLLGLL